MTISIIGGLDRLKRHYEDALKEKGHKMKLLSQNKRQFYNYLSNVNGIIIFTNEVSHNAMWCAIKYAKTLNIPVARSHSSSISGLKKSINKIEDVYFCKKKLS